MWPILSLHWSLLCFQWDLASWKSDHFLRQAVANCKRYLTSETNSKFAPQNEWLEDVNAFPFGMAHFQALLLFVLGAGSVGIFRGDRDRKVQQMLVSSSLVYSITPQKEKKAEQKAPWKEEFHLPLKGDWLCFSGRQLIFKGDLGVSFRFPHSTRCSYDQHWWGMTRAFCSDPNINTQQQLAKQLAASAKKISLKHPKCVKSVDGFRVNLKLKVPRV